VGHGGEFDCAVKRCRVENVLQRRGSGKLINYPSHKDPDYVAQEPSFYTRANAVTAGGADGHGFVYGASPDG
jgi:hypothetical protein